MTYYSVDTSKIDNNGSSTIWKRATELHQMGFSISPPIQRGVKSPRFSWKQYQKERASAAQIYQWGEKFPGDNYGIITGAISGIVVLDADDQEAKKLIENVCPETPMMQISGSKRKSKHYIYRYPDGCERIPNVSKLRYHGKQFNLDIRGDGGLIVGCNSIHKDGGTYTEVTEWTPKLLASCPAFDPMWFDWNPAKTTRTIIKPSHPDMPLNNKQKQAQEWMRTKSGSIKGKGAENYAFALAIDLLWGFDLSPDEALPVFFEWGQQETNVDEFGRYYPWSEPELMHKLEGAVGQADNNGKPRGHLLQQNVIPDCSHLYKKPFKRHVVIEEIEQGIPATTDSIPASPVEKRRKGYRLNDFEQMPPASWLIKDHITTKSLSVVFGSPGVGKTFFALDMALSISSGLPFLGIYPVDKTPVLYLMGEGGNGMTIRIKAWMEFKNAPYPNDCLFVPYQFDFSNRAEIGDLERIAELDLGTAQGLIVVDTLNRYFGGGDENKTQDMTKFIGVCDSIKQRFGCSVSIIHHTGWADDKRERGSIALRGATDTAIALDGTPSIVVKNVKQKDAKEFDEYLLRQNVIMLGTDQNGDDITSLALSPFDPDSQKLTLLPRAKREALLALWKTFNANPFKFTDAVAALGKAGSTASVTLRFLVEKGVLDQYEREDGKRYLINRQMCQTLINECKKG